MKYPSLPRILSFPTLPLLGTNRCIGARKLSTMRIGDWSPLAPSGAHVADCQLGGEICPVFGSTQSHSIRYSFNIVSFGKVCHSPIILFLFHALSDLELDIGINLCVRANLSRARKLLCRGDVDCKSNTLVHFLPRPHDWHVPIVVEVLRLP